METDRWGQVMGKKIDLTGKHIGHLVVVSESGTDNHGHIAWKCRCSCGNTKVISGMSLRNGDTRSCGCLQITSVSSHGLSKTRIAKIHDGIVQRCDNTNCKDYDNYGGRGIKMHLPWRKSVKEFSDWAFVNGYKENLFIDRIDNSGDYEPGNCRFVTITENNRNKRNNVYYTNNSTGETKCASEWSYHLGGGRALVHKRIKAGWDVQKAITERVRPTHTPTAVTIDRFKILGGKR